MSDVYTFIRKMTAREHISPQEAQVLTACVDSLVDEVTDKQKRIKSQSAEIAALKAENERLRADLAQAAPDVKALRDAAKSVEEWWLSEGMKHFIGAPYAMFALRSALDTAVAPEPAQAGWRPIETAPKDGTRVLYTNKFGNIGHCKWYEAYGDDEQSCWWDEDRDDECLPRFWMPALPSAPGGQ